MVIGGEFVDTASKEVMVSDIYFHFWMCVLSFKIDNNDLVILLE